MKNAGYIVAGHSHIFAMGAPQDYAGPIDLVKTPDGSGYFLMEVWQWGRSAAYWDALVEVCGGRDVLMVFHGNQHHGRFLFAPEPLFDFFDPRSPELLSGATLVPRRLVEAFFDSSLDPLRTLLPRLFAAGCRSVRLVGTPPPKSDLHAFRDLIMESHVAKAFATRTGRDVRHAQITPPSLLLKLWRVVQELTARATSDVRCRFVGVPDEAVDDNGFLGRRFYDYVPSDITHGNRAFGQLMLKQSLVSLVI